MKTIFLITAFLFLHSEVEAAKPQIQLAQLYSSAIILDEFLVSEKLDGVRGYFDGEKFISRQGNIINAPQWFTKNFPREVLDGELWIGREKFEEISALIHQESPNDTAWQQVKFMVFDLPKSSEVFEKRYEALKNLVAQSNSKYLQLVKQFEVKDHQSLHKLLESITKQGGEGLMLHRKNSLYKAERNGDLLKLKSFNDSEGVVIKHIKGRGKYQNQLGALLIATTNKHGDKIHLKIGSGFSDQQRQNPPKIGTTITYKFIGYTKNGTPRFATFWRERKDLTDR